MDQLKSVKSYFSNISASENFKYIPPIGYQIDGRAKWPCENICIIIDVSGSTNNSNNRDRFDTDISPINEIIVEQKTKIIVLAELEGVANFLCSLMTRFDLTGVNLSIKSFSTNFYDCYRQEIESNMHLFESVIRVFDELIIYECGSTDLHKVLTNVFSLYTEEFQMILATDGQPNNKKMTFDFLKSTQVPFNLVVIGAGSIQENISTRYFYMTRNDIGQMERRLIDSTLSRAESDWLQSVVPSISNIVSECDMEYCQSLVELSKTHGLYMGAYGDYSNIREITLNYIDILDIFDAKFVVRLGNDLTYLPVSVSRTLTKYNFAIASVKIGDVCNHYLYTYIPYTTLRNKQYAIEPLEFLNSEECCAIVPVLDFSDMLETYLTQRTPLKFIKLNDRNVFQVVLSTSVINDRLVLRERTITPTVLQK